MGLIQYVLSISPANSQGTADFRISYGSLPIPVLSVLTGTLGTISKDLFF